MSSSTDIPLVVNQIPVSIEFPREQGQLIETLTLVYNRIANTLNSKEGGLYSAQEYGSNQQYNLVATGSFKNVYRKCFDMVALNGGNIGAGATVTFAHGISSVSQLVHMYGGATNSDAPPKFFPLPYVSATAITDQIQIYITSTNVILVNGATQTALTAATIVVEILKN